MDRESSPGVKKLFFNLPFLVVKVRHPVNPTHLVARVVLSFTCIYNGELYARPMLSDLAT